MLSPVWSEWNSFYLRIYILPGRSYLHQEFLREKAFILSKALLFLTEDKVLLQFIFAVLLPRKLEVWSEFKIFPELQFIFAVLLLRKLFLQCCRLFEVDGFESRFTTEVHIACSLQKIRCARIIIRKFIVFSADDY